MFLRILEYYSGILFLTTNRVGAIDDAFRSRLHLTLFYPRLDRGQTLRIWRSNFNRLKLINQERQDHNRTAIKYDKEQILAWAKKCWDQLDWNGRQIRNAFQTAIALAEFRNRNDKSPRSPVLRVDHFIDLANASKDFNDYLQAVHGGDEYKAATKAKWRADTKYQRGHKSERTFDLSEENDSESSSSHEELDDEHELKAKRSSSKRSKKVSKDDKSKHSKSKGKKKGLENDENDSDVSHESDASDHSKTASSKIQKTG